MFDVWRICVLDELLRMRRGAGLPEEAGEDGCNRDRGDKQGVTLLKHMEREWSVIREFLNEPAKGGRRECAYYEDEEIDGSCRASAHAFWINFLDDNVGDRRSSGSKPAQQAENVRR